jgi:hypothetical protein
MTSPRSIPIVGVVIEGNSVLGEVVFPAMDGTYILGRFFVAIEFSTVVLTLSLSSAKSAVGG